MESDRQRGGLEVAGCDGIDFSAGRGCNGVVAPLFSDYVGKPWEFRFPIALERYYDACAGVARTSCGGVLFIKGGKVVESCSRGGYVGDREGCAVGSFSALDVGGCEYSRRTVEESAFSSLQGCRCGVDSEESVFGTSKHGDGRPINRNDECGDVLQHVSSSSAFNTTRGVIEQEIVKEGVPGAFGNSCNEKESSSSVGFNIQNVVGANVERNRVWRKERKERKQKKKNNMKENWRKKDDMFSLDSLVRDQDIELRTSLAAKWKAENALAKMRAERQLAVLNASDIQDEVKQHRTKLNATIERNMVSIEKTHATLRATGNVAGEFHGSAETVMTPGLSSGTISPDSSASMQEFRAVQKRNLDLENKIKIATEKLGVDIEHIDLYDKEIWTNNSVNEAILDKMYPDGYGMDGTFYDEGKVRVIPT